MAKTFCSGIPRMKLAVESCCEAHDRAYTRGATGTRAEADLALYACLRGSGRRVFAWVVWLVVRAFGWVRWRRNS